MIFKTKGIVLHRFKYSDSRIIAKIYTEEFGLQSYLIYASDSKKGRQTKSLLQPFVLLDMQVYHKENSELQKIKEIANHFPFVSIPFEIKKNTIALFLSEFIIKVIRENEPDRELFEFFMKSIIFFDSEIKNFHNFHILFLFKMCSFIGIIPENNYSENKQIFDLTAGRFMTGIPAHKNYSDIQLSSILHKLFYVKYKNINKIDINNALRKQLLQLLIDYFTIHLGKPGKMKSLDVLKQIF